jgi:hypothetical protein
MTVRLSTAYPSEILDYPTSLSAEAFAKLRRFSVVFEGADVRELFLHRVPLGEAIAFVLLEVEDHGPRVRELTFLDALRRPGTVVAFHATNLGSYRSPRHAVGLQHRPTSVPLPTHPTNLSTLA